MTGSNKVSRRHFLFAASAGSAAAATALVVAGNKDVTTLQKSKAPHAGSGYQVTEHVRNYYRTAKV